jgi:hypothetical protein
MSEEQQSPPVVVIGPDGQPIPASEPEVEDGPLSGLVSSPDKVMRIGTMVKQLLEEVRAAPLDDAARKRLVEIQRRSVSELADGLSADLRAELETFVLPFGDDEIPSNDELRIAQAQLVGWLEGLFHGIQTALVAQQMSARAQVEQMRGRQLPPGGRHDGPGQYL